MEEDVRRAGRADALESPDDSRRGHRRLQRIGLEPLVEEVGRAHGHELDERGLVALWEVAEPAGQPDQRHPRPRIEPPRVGRHHGEDRLDEPGHVDHELAVLLVGLGVPARPAAKLAHGSAVVVDPPQVVAVQWRERAVQRKDLQAVLGEFQLPDDLWPEQADHVGRHAEAEAREDLFGHGRPAQDVPALQDERPQPSLGQVGGAHQAVVAAADEDDVVLAHVLLRSGSKNGFFTTCAEARLRRCSTVISMSSALPGLAHGARR